MVNDSLPKNTTTESNLIEGYLISDGVIYNKDCSIMIKDVGVESLALTTRPYYCIRRAGIHTLTKLLQTSVEDLASSKNMGTKSVEEIVLVTERYLQKNIKSVIDKGSEGINESHCDETNPLPMEDTYLCDDRNKTLIEDIPLGKLSLSVRTSNAMARCGYHYVHEIADFTYDDFKQIKNMGDKSAREIYEKVQTFLKEYRESSETRKITPDAKTKAAENAPKVISILKSFRQECEACGANELINVGEELLKKARLNDIVLLCSIEEFNDVYKNPNVISAVESRIVNSLNQHRIEGMSLDEIKDVLPKSLTEESLTKRLNDLIERGIVKYTDKYFTFYPLFSDVLTESTDDRGAQVIIMRTKGKTLEEIAQSIGGLTRERVRQIESRFMEKLLSKYCQMDEDKYKYIFITYELDDRLMVKYLGFSDETIYYLKYKYKENNKKQPIDESALDNQMLPISLKKQIEKYILSKKIRIGNEYVEAKRNLVEDALFPVLCKDTISAYDFIDRYNEFVTENQKPDLLITDDLCRSRTNKFAASSKILWTLNQKMRYYDTEAIDKLEFLDSLNLNQYRDIEISAKKVLDETPEIMEEYDIRNEYELHNLLKKILEPSDCPELALSRNPIMQFGVADRKKQVVDLLAQLTPISQNDFADAYSELYGVQPGTVLANYLPYIKQYLNKDKVLDMDVPHLLGEQLERLKCLLVDDFYPIEKLLDIYRNEYPNEPVEKINHYTLHQLGFHVYSGYVVRLTYHTAQEYFSSLLNNGDIINANLFPQKIMYIQAYSSVLLSLLENYELIEFLPKKYIKMSRLTELFRTTKEDILGFCLHVKEFTDKSFFTIQSLKKDGFDDALFELGFDDCFYSNILFFNRDYFTPKKTGGTILFTFGKQPFVFSDFIEWLLYREESLSMDVYELIDLLYDKYGINFDRYDIKGKILPGTQLYYSDITEKLYADYEIYFDEI